LTASFYFWESLKERWAFLVGGGALFRLVGVGCGGGYSVLY